MPNHVTNKLIITGSVDDVAAAKQLLIGKVPAGWSSSLPDGTPIIPPPEDGVDFNLLIPMPPLLEKVISPIKKGENGRTMLYANDNILVSSEQREATEEEQKILDSIPEGDWYNWSIDNWGTKWNGYNFSEIDNNARYEFVFDTAWSPPNPIFDELVSRYPGINIDINWFDEGWCHAGTGTIGQGSETVRSESLFCEPSDAIYEEVYGSKPISDEEWDRQYVVDSTTKDRLRLADNFTCEDVQGASDNDGFFPITAVIHSDDEQLDDDDLSDIRQFRDAIAARLGLDTNGWF